MPSSRRFTPSEYPTWSSLATRLTPAPFGAARVHNATTGCDSRHAASRAWRCQNTELLSPTSPLRQPTPRVCSMVTDSGAYMRRSYPHSCPRPVSSHVTFIAFSPPHCIPASHAPLYHYHYPFRRSLISLIPPRFYFVLNLTISFGSDVLVFRELLSAAVVL